jgi:transcriptional regulator with XRE-family HTH domain
MDDAAVLRAFGSAVRARRKAMQGSRAGEPMSQEELAERAGVHRTYVGDVERGQRNVSLINVWRLARALGVSLSALMGDVEEQLSS